jgi:3-dehydroquinate synthase
MVETIEISRTGRPPSQVIVGETLPVLSELLPTDRRVIVITDSNVYALYGEVIDNWEHIVITTGEEHKTLATVEQLYLRLIEMGADRRTYLVGFGGGIVTDVTGFVASTYMRGVGFGFVATTLLAQVDASVGGKNGVNVGGYKNMAGVFNQPDFVLCDTGVLATLPVREFRAGMAEMIKAGVIADSVLFEIFERNTPEELLADSTLLGRAIMAALRVKARIVEADERETGERRKLNLGHTIAHAVEKLSRTYNHGEAVAIGLVSVADIAMRLGELSLAERDRIIAVIQRSGLPTHTNIPPTDIMTALSRDKKVEQGVLWLVVPRTVGDVVVRRVSFTHLSELL